MKKKADKPSATKLKDFREFVRRIMAVPKAEIEKEEEKFRKRKPRTR